MTLVAHVDTKRVGRDDVIAVPTPDRTNTWGVIGHDQLIKTLEKASVDAGYEISGETYSLSADGGKMFGVFNYLPEDNNADKAFSLGFRNSINKTMSVGITAGLVVFVCDNLAFTGDFIKFRKHTGRLDMDELKEIADDAVSEMQFRLPALSTWHDELIKAELSRADKDALFIRSMEKNIIPFGRANQLHELFFEKKNTQNGAYYADNLQGFHGAVTQIWGQVSLIGTGPKHKQLRRFLDDAKLEIQEHGILRNAA